MKITSKMNGKALTLSEGQFDTKKGSFIFRSYKGSDNQHFNFYPEQNRFRITCVAGDMALDCKDESEEIYNPIIGWKGHEKANQRWYVQEFEQDCYVIENAKSGLCLELEGGIDADGMDAVQNKFYHNLNQLWDLEEV